MVKAKKKPPSRIRYEERNPVISIRVDQDTAKSLRELSEKGGKSLGTLIKENLAVQQRNEEKTYTAAIENYRIWYFCAKCGGKIFISPNGQSHKAIIEYMKEKRWYHNSCPTKQ